MKYEKRVIIYLDILGFADIIHLTANAEYDKAGRISDIQKLFRQIREILYADEKQMHLTKSKMITNFSDLVVISFLASEFKHITHELYEMQVFISNCILKGYLLRGSIIYGDLIHDEDMIFGPGLIEAYEIEQTKARYPRILIDKAIVNDQKLSANDRLVSIRNREIDGIISIDEDGEFYIDYFAKIKEITDNFSQYIIYVKQFTNLLLSIVDNQSLREKVEWLIPKYNSLIVSLQKCLFQNKEPIQVQTKDDLILMIDILNEVCIDSYKDKL